MNAKDKKEGSMEELEMPREGRINETISITYRHTVSSVNTGGGCYVKELFSKNVYQINFRMYRPSVYINAWNREILFLYWQRHWRSI